MRFKNLITVALTLFLGLSSSVYAQEFEMSGEYSYVDKVFGYASELYIDDTLSKEEILIKALNKYLEENPDAVLDIVRAGFSQIDDYTQFYSYDEYHEYVNNINHTFYGIGVIIQKEGDYIQIVTLLDDGSAAEAGIQVGDKISKVNGVSMKGKSVDAVQQAVVGELNTSVTVTVLRDNEEYTYELTRRPVSAATIDYIVFNNNVAYVSVINFAQDTATEFKKMLSELDELGVSEIILDLRNNPGGYLISAVEIAELIVPEGIIVQTMYRNNENNFTYYSKLKDVKYKFAVLVNENTASAAEILTGALQDSGVGTVIGKKTFGKAVIQEMFSLIDSNTFKITTGRYLTRDGREINEKGLEPDIEVENTTKPINMSDYKGFNYAVECCFGDKCDNVLTAKERMSLLGYIISSDDNTFDSELEAAVLDFQIANNLRATGSLNKTTMSKIDDEFSKKETIVDNQLYKAFEHFGGTRNELDSFLNSYNE